MNFQGYSRGRGGRGGGGGGGGGGGQQYQDGGNRGGGRGRGTFRGRGGRGGGGGVDRGGHSSNAAGGGPSDEPCKAFLATGECRYGDGCHFAHNLRLHREITSGVRDAHVRSIALYEANGMVVYSEGSKVKFLTSELELSTEVAMEGPVTALLIVGHFLFVAYEAVVPGVTVLPVGLLKSYYLATKPFTEFAMRAPGMAWAHRNEVIALDAAVMTEDPSVPPVLFSGGGC